MANQKPKKSRLDHMIFYISVTVILVMKMSVVQGSFKDAEFCEASKLTRTVVDSCPEDNAGVIEAANRKNCSAIKSTCLGRLEYHCVINPWGNLTIEVCAPATWISTGFCAEYNEGGGKIQEYYKQTCSTCENKYLSTDAYKYPECYPKLKGNAKKRDSFPQYHSPPAKNGVKANILNVTDELFCIQILLGMIYLLLQYISNML
ncbi:uncharacterized protein LOC134253421 [Saccostrea cucullata]|uniref:uncharacterized protein LOC134253421 n=1 Tax=Saccostrea cuccullata TaxID=36930 RepID=UPI002ED659BD